MFALWPTCSPFLSPCSWCPSPSFTPFLEMIKQTDPVFLVILVTRFSNSCSDDRDHSRQRRSRAMQLDHVSLGDVDECASFRILNILDRGKQVFFARVRPKKACSSLCSGHHMSVGRNIAESSARRILCKEDDLRAVTF